MHGNSTATTDISSSSSSVIQSNVASKIKFDGLQTLRFWAAALVVVMHATQAAGQHILQLGPHSYWGKGGFGVHIFFVLSGFVMAFSTPVQQGTSATLIFFRKRFVRIVPSYWLYTTIKIILLLATGVSADVLYNSHTLASYFFVPASAPDGTWLPLLQVGWTLNFEMVFYLIFGLAIFLGAARLVFCTILISVLFTLGSVADDGVLQFYARGIIFEFLIGVMIANLAKSGYTGSPRVGAAMVIIGMFAIFLPMPTRIDNAVTFGLPAALIVYGFILMEDAKSKLLHSKLLLSLGDSSYSLYLTHSIFIAAAVRWCANHSFSYTSTVIFLVLGSIIFGHVCFLLIERPLTAVCERLIPKIQQKRTEGVYS